MNFDNAVALQTAILRDILDFQPVEISATAAAASTGFSTGGLVPPPDRRNNREAYDRLARGIALGLGSKPSGGYSLDVLIQNESMRRDPILDVITERARGETGFEVIGRVRPAGWHIQPTDTLRMGSSIGHLLITAGTLGCFVRQRTTGAVGFLSNNHVLAAVNRGKVGDEIVQPGPADGGTRDELVGRLASFVPLAFEGEVNEVDAAFATRIKHGPPFDFRGVLDSPGRLYGKLRSSHTVNGRLGDAVLKTGRSTGLTHGRIDRINVSNVTVPYGRKVARFDGQMTVRSMNLNPFAVPGDSGSLILTQGMDPVGLLFAVSEKGGMFNSGVTFANPIDRVLAALDLDIVVE
jgi:hypothetical protein